MSFWTKIRWKLSLYYVDAFEKEVDEFLTQIEDLPPLAVREKVLRFMQQDFVRFSVYLEWKFKGYQQLKKSKRRALYKNADLIHADFKQYCQTKNIDLADKSQIVQALQWYLSPDNKFLYQESSAFFGLLQNPHTHKLVGDCNQICSLYVALSAPYFLPTFWQIHLYDAHVALVFENQEIEATNGTTKKIVSDGEILPIEALVAVNILDISEKNRRQFEIVPERFLQSAALVQALCPHNPLAQKNLQAALHNMAVDLAKKNNFDLAQQYFERLNNQSALQNLYIQAVNYFLKSNNFVQSEKWAEKSADKQLLFLVWNNRASQALEQKKYSEAKKYFEKAQQPENVKIVLQTEMFDWYESVKGLTKIKDLKAKKSAIKKIYDRAKDIQHEDMKDWCESVLREV